MELKLLLSHTCKLNVQVPFIGGQQPRSSLSIVDEESDFNLKVVLYVPRNEVD